MHRRRLVNPSGDRLKILDVEGVGVEEAVPTHGIERVMPQGVQGVATVGAHHHRKLAALSVARQLQRGAHIALTERRMLHQLTVLVAVALRRLDAAAPRLNDVVFDLPNFLLGIEEMFRLHGLKVLPEAPDAVGSVLGLLRLQAASDSEAATTPPMPATANVGPTPSTLVGMGWLKQFEFGRVGNFFWLVEKDQGAAGVAVANAIASFLGQPPEHLAAAGVGGDAGGAARLVPKLGPSHRRRGGPARRYFHGILPVKPARHPQTGALRYNLTFRKAL